MPPTTSLKKQWWLDPLAWVELFLLSNIAFLGVDILLAHSASARWQTTAALPLLPYPVFKTRGEWVPIVFSALTTLVLLLSMLWGGMRPLVPEREPVGSLSRRLARLLGLAVGWGAIGVGVAGLVLHLRSDFFGEQTIKNLVYTAPFVAPLAYTGVGLVLILNRTVDSRSLDWARWLLLLAMGGFIGNFVLSLADHAQNGFYHKSEWTGVIAGALAVGFLIAVVIAPRDRLLRGLTWVVMGAQVVVGLVGAYLHVAGNLESPTASLWERFVYGAPAFAPLLFADIAVLVVLGLWALESTLRDEEMAGARVAEAAITGVQDSR